jgi:hypothetical protein
MKLIIQAKFNQNIFFFTISIYKIAKNIQKNKILY